MEEKKEVKQGETPDKYEAQIKELNEAIRRLQQANEQLTNNNQQLQQLNQRAVQENNILRNTVRLLSNLL